MNKLFLGEPLLKEEYITYDQLSDALDSHNEYGRSFEKIFVENGYIRENDLLKVVSHELGYGYMDKPMTFHQPSSSKLISESYARANNILPLYIEDGKLVFANSEPLNFNVFEEIAMISGLEAKPFVSEASIIESAIEKAYSFGQGPNEIIEGMEVSEEDKELLDRILLADSNILFTYKGRGCKHCNDTGYSGRKAVFEVLPINETLQEMIAHRATYSQMKDRVVNHQHLPLLKDDVIRVLKGGDTSIQEAKKVLFNNDIFKD